MLSRIAENLYWIGRYIERVENTARLLDVNYHAIVEAPVVPGAKGIVTEQWAPLLALTGDEGAFREHFDRADGRTVPEWLAFHPQNSSSIRSSLSRAREDARGLRDRGHEVEVLAGFLDLLAGMVAMLQIQHRIQRPVVVP